MARASEVVVDLFPQAKKIDRVASDQALLDQVTDKWNEWAKAHGCPQVKFLTQARAKQCRNRLSDITNGHGPIAAFEEILAKCEQSFFIKGQSRTPLNFDRLMQEGFLVRMMEGQFDYRAPERRSPPWQR
jgi:hypothetical protein